MKKTKYNILKHQIQLYDVFTNETSERIDPFEMLKALIQEYPATAKKILEEMKQ